jgi:hypothetical protein
MLCSPTQITCQTLGIALSYTSLAKCVDGRDKIYALRSLLLKAEADLVRPDYTKSMEKAYEDLFLNFVVHRKYSDLELLRHCNLSKSLTTAPSWVPDWRNHSLGRFQIHSNSGGSVCKAHNIAPGVLRVSGVQFDSIQLVKELSGPSAASSTDVERVLKYIAPENMFDCTYPTGCSLLEAFCWTTSGYVPVEISL